MNEPMKFVNPHDMSVMLCLNVYSFHRPFEKLIVFDLAVIPKTRNAILF